MKSFTLTKHDILANFDNGAYNRGFYYYRKQKVVKYDIYDDKTDAVFIHSKVDGSEPYTQSISLSHFDNMLIESDCSCPVGYNCKHAVAVLFQMMSNGQTLKRKDEALSWLDSWMKIHQNKVYKVEDTQNTFLIFRLFENSYDDFDFYKAKILKNGSLSKGTKVSKENMFYYAQYDWKYEFLTDKDRVQIAYLSNTLNMHKLNHFEGEYGVFVLKKLCETQQCYFRNNSVPLRFVNDVKVLIFE